MFIGNSLVRVQVVSHGWKASSFVNMMEEVILAFSSTILNLSMFISEAPKFFAARNKSWEGLVLH